MKTLNKAFSDLAKALQELQCDYEDNAREERRERDALSKAATSAFNDREAAIKERDEYKARLEKLESLEIETLKLAGEEVKKLRARLSEQQMLLDSTAHAIEAGTPCVFFRDPLGAVNNVVFSDSISVEPAPQYRMLEAGEIIQEGDEADLGCGWQYVTSSIGMKMINEAAGSFRRRISIKTPSAVESAIGAMTEVCPRFAKEAAKSVLGDTLYDAFMRGARREIIGELEAKDAERLPK